jgi:hypothetical protein
MTRLSSANEWKDGSDRIARSKRMQGAHQSEPEKISNIGRLVEAETMDVVAVCAAQIKGSEVKQRIQSFFNQFQFSVLKSILKIMKFAVRGKKGGRNKKSEFLR